MHPCSSRSGYRAPLLPFVALAAGLLAACSNSTPASPPTGAAAGAAAPLSVTVIEAQPQNIPAAIEVVAETEGARETEVRARVGGILVRRLYQEGERVRAGQPLFQIDRATYEIALAEAHARAEQTASDVARLEELLATGAVSRKAHADAVAAAAIAQAALRQAELNLSWTTVTAPVAGVTGRAVKSEGSLISTGEDSLLTTIYQLDPMWVRFSLAESDVAKLPGGRLTEAGITGVELLLPDGSVYRERGRVNFVASTVDPTLGTRQRCAPSSAMNVVFSCPASSCACGCWRASGRVSFSCRRSPSSSRRRGARSCWPAATAKSSPARYKRVNGAAGTG